jgi:hypothetical protein
MRLVVSGLLNKQVGGELGISEITVEGTPGASDAEDEADSLAELGENRRETRLAPAPKAELAAVGQLGWHLPEE